ncbi:MAG: MOP flippase family protein [Saprospiraceae bacterium]
MSELKAKAIKGVRWTALSAGIVAVGGILQTIILTRLLDRADFGAMAIVSIALGLSVQLVDMGFSNAIIQDQGTSHKQLSSLYWLNVLMSLIIGSLVWISAPFVASFYRIPELTNMLHLIVPAFILSGFAMQFQALMQKDLRFGVLAGIEISSFLAGFCVAVWMAWLDYGPYALVGGALTKVGISTILFIIFGLRIHRPDFRFSWEAIRPYRSFGLYQVMEKLIGYVAINLDVLLIGRLLSQDVLGTYEVIKRLLIQPWYIINPIVTKVTYPVMAQVQKEHARFKNIALRTVHMVAAVNVPIYISCAIGAGLLVPVLFDSRWASGELPFRWLAIVFLIRAVLNPLGSAAMAQKRADISFILNAIMFAGLFGAIYLGSFNGLLGILKFLLLFTSLLFLPFFYLVVKPIVQATWLDFFKNFIPELVFAAAGFGLAFWLASWAALSPIPTAVLYLGLGSILYAIPLLYFRRHLIDELKQMLLRR